MGNLIMKLQPVLGVSIGDAMEDASRIAAMLGLVYVEFESNGSRYHCRPDGTAVAFDDGTPGNREWNGVSWR